MTPAPNPKPTRRARRHSLGTVLQVSSPVTPDFFARVKNVSATGALMRCKGELKVGDLAFLHLPTIGEVPCRVVRRRQMDLGVRFARRIPVQDL